jgi:GNAT superfamily N-acetyltransferase
MSCLCNLRVPFVPLSRPIAKQWRTWRDNLATNVQGKKFESGLGICRTRTNTPFLLLNSLEAKSRAGSELSCSEAETASYVGINGLVVDESIRSRGIGKILLSAAEEWARSIGFDVISVHSNVTRDRAHRFYLRNGYAHVKTQKEFHKSL